MQAKTSSIWSDNLPLKGEDPPSSHEKPLLVTLFLVFLFYFWQASCRLPLSVLVNGILITGLGILFPRQARAEGVVNQLIDLFHESSYMLRFFWSLKLFFNRGIKYLLIQIKYGGFARPESMLPLEYRWCPLPPFLYPFCFDPSLRLALSLELREVLRGNCFCGVYCIVFIYLHHARFIILLTTIVFILNSH